MMTARIHHLIVIQYLKVDTLEANLRHHHCHHRRYLLNLKG